MSIRYFLSILFLVFSIGLTAQSRYGVEGIPMCWTTAGGIDSNLTKFVLASTTGTPTKTILFENASGVKVTVSGGKLKFGFCNCASGGSGTPTGPAGGSLTGNYPNPGFAANTVGNSQIVNNSVDSTKALNLALSDISTAGYPIGMVPYITNDGLKYRYLTTTTLDTVYAPSHGFNIPSKGYIPISRYSGNWRSANSSADSMFHSAFIIKVLNSNTLVISGGGYLVKPSHGLKINETYYLNDDGSERLTADSTFVIPTVRVVSDSVINLLTGYYFKNSSVVVPSNIITGTGTTNQIPVFSGVGTITGSGTNGIRWNGTNLNIGATIAPDFVGTNLWGGLSISNTTGGDGFLLYGNTGGTALTNLYTYQTTSGFSTRGVIRAGMAAGSDLVTAVDSQFPLQIYGTGGFIMPKGTEAQQPSSGLSSGVQRWSTTYDNLQIRGASTWEYFVKADNAFGTNTVNTLAAWNGSGNRLSKITKTITPTGTTSSQTINQLSGSVNIEATATSKVVTNSTVTANSLIFITIQGNDTTAYVKGVVATAGSFTIYVNTPASEIKVAFFVVN